MTRLPIPKRFTPDGVLPPGQYELTLGELGESMLVHGPEPKRRTWDVRHRKRLVENLSVLARQLWSIGIHEIFVGGSFVEDKDRPSDIDGYFICDLRLQVTGELERRLNAIDPEHAWGWSRGRDGQIPLRRHYSVELWPYSYGTMFGKDDEGRELELADAFRRTKFAPIPKGIVKLSQQ